MPTMGQQGIDLSSTVYRYQIQLTHDGIDGTLVTDGKLVIDADALDALDDSLEIDCDLIPLVDAVYDLGSALSQFKEIHGMEIYVTTLLNMGNTNIISLADPTNPQEAATKAYVDTLVTTTVVYEGTYDANANSEYPLSPNLGDMYLISVSGTLDLPGGGNELTFDAGDWILFNGATWDKISNSDLVTSVDGQTGSVSVVSDLAYNESNWVGITDIAASKKAIRDQIETMLTSIADKLPLGGGSLTDFLTLHADPTNDAHASNKAYVDSKTSPTSYSESGWNGVELIGASKNAIRDQIEVILQKITNDIATHKGIAGDHHVKWTTGDTEGVITAEIVGGESINNAIDALISTHNVADKHVGHAGVSITAGTGLTGGGTIESTRTINCTISQYTDVMVESIITAEIVAGQSINNAIDALISDHQGVVTAHHSNANDHPQAHNLDTHGNPTGSVAMNTKKLTGLAAGTINGDSVRYEQLHTKWTTGDTEGVITTELANGQSIDLAIDALISTHNATDKHIAHSGVTITAGTGLTGGGSIETDLTINCSITQYTDGNVEGIINTEINNGQSIDNAIDALISTHNVTDKHIAHSGVTITAGTGLTGGGSIETDFTINCSITQYTNSNVESVITAELVNSQSIDLAIDALILTHKNSANEHHTPPIASDFSHDGIANPNGNAEEQHMTSNQIDALHTQSHDNTYHSTNYLREVLANNTQLEFSIPTGNGGVGIIIKDLIGASVVAYDLVYRHRTSGWLRCDKDTLDEDLICTGISLEATGSNKKVLLFGLVRNSAWSTAQVYGGSTSYVGDNGDPILSYAGFTTGDYIQRIGYGIADDILFFKPDMTVIEKP